MKIFKVSILEIISILFLSFGATYAQAGSAKLSWDANSDNDLKGYKIYYGASSYAATCPVGYANSILVPKNANQGYWFDDLTPGKTYYFQVTALDTSNNESGCSVSPGEVSKLITYRGDINPVSDHRVNINDFTLLASDYGKTSFCGAGLINKTDINRDCVVNIDDFTLLADDYGQSF